MPPSIVTDLTAATNYAYVGGSCAFAITASGDPLLHYHWEQNGVTPVGTDSPTLSLTSLTLASAGSYSVTVTNPYGSGQILQQRYSGGYNGEYEFGVNADGTLYFEVYRGGGYQFSFSSTNASKLANDGNWHHVVAVRSGTSGLLYADGILVGDASGPVAPLAPPSRFTLAQICVTSHLTSAARCAMWRSTIAPCRPPASPITPWSESSALR